MLDPTNLSSALGRPQHGGSTSNSSYLRPLPTSIHHCTACYTLFSRSEPSRDPSFLKSPRPLPIPPHFSPPLPIMSASSLPIPSSSTSNVTSTTPHLLSGRSQSISPRPLPKMPRSTPTPLGITRRGTSMEERSSPLASPAGLARSPSAPQQPANEIRCGNISKLQCHPGKSTPADPVPPTFDAGELSECPSSDEEHYFDPPMDLTTPEYFSESTDAVPSILEVAAGEEPEKLVGQYSRRWLREKNGRRWVERNYDTIAQCLRELR